MICTRNCLYQFDGACGLKLCSSDATNRCPLVPDEAAADTPYKPPMTNADHIRAMADEELARFLAEVENRRSAAGGGAIWKGAAHALEWLRQPVKEGTHE